MNSYIIKASENRDFFTNKELKNEEITIVQLFQFESNGTEIFNSVVTSKSNVQNLVGYNPTKEDVTKVIIRNKSLLDLLIDAYTQLSFEFRSSMRLVNHYKTVDAKFINELITEKEKERYDTSLENATDLKVKMQQLKENIELLDVSIKHEFIEKSFNLLNGIVTTNTEESDELNQQEEIKEEIFGN